MSRLEDEIASIPRLLAPSLQNAQPSLQNAAKLWKQAQPAALFTIARGTSDAAATFATYCMARATSTPVGSFTPSLASLQGFQLKPGADILALGISQSGASPDLVAALSAFDADRRIALTNVDGSPMEEAASLRLPIGAGEEVSVAATKSFACSLAVLSALASTLAGDELPEGGTLAKAAAKGHNDPVSLDCLADCTHCFVLGRGSTFALAQEAALKLKETASLHAEAISAAEVHHGPKELAGPQLPVLAFVPGGNIGEQVRQSVAALAQNGSPTVLIDAAHDVEIAGVLRALVSFYTALPDLARKRGRDPNKQESLSKVTLTT